jgi:metal-responsive CopG/Arc/MetJ family transcriptional regulator
MISAEGKMDRIQALAKAIMKMRGITQLKLSTVTP